jgi:hypothetical protein
MDTDGTSKNVVKMKKMSEEQALVALLIAIVVTIYVVIGFVDTVFDPKNVSLQVDRFVDLHVDRTDLAKSIRDYANSHNKVDTDELNTAIRETERAHVLLEQEDNSREALAIFEEQYADLDVALKNKDYLEIFQSKEAFTVFVNKVATQTSQFPSHRVLRNKPVYTTFQEALAGNLADIEKARLDYNKSAFNFNKEYSQGWPERFMKRAPRMLLPEKEPVGPEFGALYGTPASK